MILKYSDLKVMSDSKYCTSIWISGTPISLPVLGVRIPERYPRCRDTQKLMEIPMNTNVRCGARTSPSPASLESDHFHSFNYH